jgi:triosephosphate isomerase (TIM)
VTRTPVIAGNWKMHGRTAEARRLAKGLRDRLAASAADRQIVVAPPYTALTVVASELAESPIALGAQNVHWEARGAYTGEVSAAMLIDAGCRWVIVGHSERRQFFGETDETVNRRARAALKAGLIPIVCVGETLAERDASRTLEVVERQVQAALLDLQAADIKTLCIAYEPVWAIGTGRTATPEQAEEVHAEIRRIVAEIVGDGTADRTRILYGGSVKPDNIDTLMKEPDIDGALVGGASLEVDSFGRIVEFRA